MQPLMDDCSCVNLRATQERQENDDFRRRIKLRMSSGDNFSINFNALIDTESPICFIKKCYILHTFIDSGRDQFCGVNGSRLRIIDRLEAMLVNDQSEYNVTLRVVPNNTMKDSMVVSRDFMKLAKLTLNDEEEIANIMNIELIDDNARIISQEMYFKEILLDKTKKRTNDLFESM